MNIRTFFLLFLMALVPWRGSAQTGFPWQNETLNYQVKGPGGAELGLARLSARVQGGPAGHWDLTFDMESSLAGFVVNDHFRSSVEKYCSLSFEKGFVHGKKKAQEKTVFDQEAHVAHRTTLPKGGTSDIPIPECGRDALAYFYMTRIYMGQGKVPQPETVLFGASYNMRMDYKGPETVTAAGKQQTADKIAVSLTGPASSHNFEMLLARDAARTPVVIRVPLPGAGSFSLELAK